MASRNTQNTVTRYGLHKKLGISKQAVYQAVDAGRLRTNDDGRIDLNDELTMRFISFHAGSVSASGQNGRGRPIEKGNAPPVDFSTDASGLLKANEAEHYSLLGSEAVPSNISEQLKQLDVRLKKIKAAKEQALYHALIKKVVPFEVAARLFGLINSSVDQGFRNFDQNHTDEIIDAVNDGQTRNEVQGLIRGHIEHALKSLKETVHSAIDQLKAED